MKHVKVCKPQKNSMKKDTPDNLKKNGNSEDSSKSTRNSLDGWACVPKGNFDQ